MKPERIQNRIDELEGWRQDAVSEMLLRIYRFPSQRAAMAFAALVVEIGEAVGRQPSIELEQSQVRVLVSGGDAGLDEQAVSLAEQLDQRI